MRYAAQACALSYLGRPSVSCSVVPAATGANDAGHSKFSKQFYDKLGHDVADELVDWFNTVDVAYRSEFRELFEAHFGRFDAKLEQRIAEVKAELKTEFNDRISALDSGLKERMGNLETRLLRWGVGLWIAALGAITAVIRLSG